MALGWCHSVEVTYRESLWVSLFMLDIRAAMVYGRVQSSQNVLITGIGGGVALIAMQICIAKGASVYVTSGSQEKIEKAIALGAKGGTSYKDSKAASCVGSFYKNLIDSCRKLAISHWRHAYKRQAGKWCLRCCY